MKKIIAALILFSSAVQSFGQGLVIVQFYANQDYITKNLCINKYKPQLKCCGICQLKKKLKEDDKKDQANSSRRYDGKLDFGSFLIYSEDQLIFRQNPSMPPGQPDITLPFGCPPRLLHPPSNLV